MASELAIPYVHLGVLKEKLEAIKKEALKKEILEEIKAARNVAKKS